MRNILFEIKFHLKKWYYRNFIQPYEWLKFDEKYEMNKNLILLFNQRFKKGKFEILDQIIESNTFTLIAKIAILNGESYTVSICHPIFKGNIEQARKSAMKRSLISLAVEFNLIDYSGSVVKSKEEEE